MQVIVSNKLTITDPTPEVVSWVKKELKISNPEYTKKARMGFCTGNTPKDLYLYEQDGDRLVVPFGVLELLPLKHDTEVVADFGARQKVDFKAEIPLYDYQEEATEAMVKAHYGILQAPAGSGKTQIGVGIASKLGCNTLWVTHTKDLLNQSKERFERYIDKRLIGTITEGKVNIGEGITFATVQTLSKLDLSLYRYRWDCIIVDECHRVAGSPTAVTQFSKVLNSLAARHKYGLSATVHRADGMIQATYSLLGKVAHIVPEEAVADKIMRVGIFPVGTQTVVSRACQNTDGTLNFAKLINYLTEDRSRNRLIVNEIVEQNRPSLILSDRTNHLQELMNMLPADLRGRAVYIDGKTKGEVREEALEDMRSGRKDFLFATYSLAKEGLDVPRLERLYMTTPQKDYAVITQSIGRIARTSEGKADPIAYDFVDNIGWCVKAYKKRCTTYRKNGCYFVEGS